MKQAVKAVHNAALPVRPASPLPAIIAAIAIFSIALILRLLYIHQLQSSYFFAPFKGGYDDFIFDNWAMEILRGNWVGDKMIYIYRMPLYVYFLSGVYYLFGHSYLAAYVVQSVIGAAACVLVYSAATMLFNRTVGIIAGLINACYGIFLFYNGMLIGETLGLCTTVGALVLLILFERTGRIGCLFGAGIVAGLSMLLRGNMLLVVPFILLWLLILLRQRPTSTIIVSLGAFLVGITIAIAPIMIRNYVYEKDVVPITALGGFNIYIGNAYGADGKYRLIPEVGTNPEEMIRNSIAIAERAAGRSLKPSAVSRYWMAATADSLRTHGIGYLFPLMAQKMLLLVNAYEAPDIWDYYFFKQYLPLLRLPLIGFSLVLPLGVVGMVLAWPYRRKLMVVYLVIIGYAVSLLAFFITSRYRIQLVPLLSIFAAYAIVTGADLVRKNPAKALAIVIATVLLAAVTWVGVAKVHFETSHNSLGILLKRAGRIDEALGEYQKALAIAPRYPTPYYNLGILYRDRGDRAQAIEYFRQAIALDPNFSLARERLRELTGE